MSPGSERTKLLAVRGSSLQLNDVFSAMKQECDVLEVEELESALDALRNNYFDIVIAETADFLPIERTVSSQQAAVVLDTLVDGVCVLGPKGRVIWANRQLKKFSSMQMESVVEICTHAFEVFSTSSDRTPGQTKRFSQLVEDGAYLEMVCSPIFDRHNNLRQIAAVVVDATNRRQQQQTIDVIECLVDELVRLDYDYVRKLGLSQRLGVLKDRIIRSTRDILGFEHFAVLLLDQETNKLKLLLGDGPAEGAERAEFIASIEGNGICGYVAATGRSYLSSNLKTDPRYLNGSAGSGSSLTVPLRMHGQIAGVLNLESTLPAKFGQNEQHRAEICAHYISLAMHMLALFPDDASEVMAHDVLQPATQTDVSLAEPLSDIITKATELMEDYIGHDDLRYRLQNLIDMVAAARGTQASYAAVKNAEVSQDCGGLTKTAVKPSGKVPKFVGVPVLSQSSDAADMGTKAESSTAATELAEARQGRVDSILEGKRVLVADDEDIIRKLIFDILSPCGCSVDLAPDGIEAIANMQETKYDLIITDVNMPGADGYEVLDHVSRGENHTPVILVTGFGYDQNHAILQACQAGQARTLFKPFKVRELIDVARAAVSASNSNPA